MADEILPGVYDITVKQTERRRSRVYLVRDDVPTLIDTGFEDTTGALFEGLAEIGDTPERVIVTHGDPDHIGGLDAVVDRYDVETWIPEQTEAGVAAPHSRYSDGDRIGSFEAVHTPGHEPDNHALVDEDAGVLVAGDALFGADLRGLPSGCLVPPPALYSENVNRAERSMERLLDYDFEAALVFHGSAVTEGAHDRLDAFVNFPGKPDWASYDSDG